MKAPPNNAPCPLCRAPVGTVCEMPREHRGPCGQPCAGAYPWETDMLGLCAGASCARCSWQAGARQAARAWMLAHVRNPRVLAWVAGLAR